MTGTLQRIDNIDVNCHDVTGMMRFYRDTLGIPLLYPYEDGGDWFAIQSGDVTVYFFGIEATPSVGTSTPPGAGITCFSFAVEDLDAAIEELDGRVAWTDEIETWKHPNGTWYRFRFFVDPEGNSLSITEPHKIT